MSFYTSPNVPLSHSKDSVMMDDDEYHHLSLLIEISQWCMFSNLEYREWERNGHT
jgi:hypothetical protein